MLTNFLLYKEMVACRLTKDSHVFLKYITSVRLFMIKKYINKDYVSINGIKEYTMVKTSCFFNFFLKIKKCFFKNNEFFFLKKHFSLLKSPYQRSRPFCKNIVMLGIYINIIFIHELHLSYYNSSINYWYVHNLNYLLFIIVSIYIFLKFIYNKYMQ